MNRHHHWKPLSAFGFRLSSFGLWSRPILCALVIALAMAPHSLRACAACYGASDAPMARGMNWGIFSLLGVVVVVLGGIAAFFFRVARRSAALAAEPVRSDPGEKASVPAHPRPRQLPGELGLAGSFALSRGTTPLLESTDSGL
jgi:hypothetical protein